MTLHRPPLTERVVIRTTPDQLRLWVRMANQQGRTLSKLIRLVMDRYCGASGELTTVEQERQP